LGSLGEIVFKIKESQKFPKTSKNWEFIENWELGINSKPQKTNNLHERTGSFLPNFLLFHFLRTAVTYQNKLFEIFENRQVIIYLG